MGRNDKIEEMIDDLQDEFADYLVKTVAQFFELPDIKVRAKKLQKAGLSEPIELWPYPILALVRGHNGNQTWRWKVNECDDEEDETDGLIDEETGEAAEFGDDRGDFEFLEKIKIARKGIFTGLNRYLDETRQQRQAEEKAIDANQSTAWEEDPDLEKIEPGDATTKSEDTRSMSEVIESIVTNSVKLNFFQRIFLFYFLRRNDEDCKKLRRAGIKFSDLDMSQSFNNQSFENCIRRVSGVVASDEANRSLLLFFEKFIIGVRDVKPPNIK